MLTLFKKFAGGVERFESCLADVVLKFVKPVDGGVAGVFGFSGFFRNFIDGGEYRFDPVDDIRGLFIHFFALSVSEFDRSRAAGVFQSFFDAVLKFAVLIALPDHFKKLFGQFYRVARFAKRRAAQRHEIERLRIIPEFAIDGREQIERAFEFAGGEFGVRFFEHFNEYTAPFNAREID